MNYLKDKNTDLTALGAKLSHEYNNNRPFPHMVFHGLFNEEVLDAVLEEFPDFSKQKDGESYDNEHELKYASSGEIHFGPRTKEFLHFLNSKPFIDFLEALTGIEGLIPDPHFFGGGLHELRNNGFLNIHADFNRHPGLSLDRRLNFLIYLNKDWTEQNGGQFELWDKNMENCEKSVVPSYNTSAVFSTTSFSYHGNPNPINCGPEKSRKSIALYYYTNGRPEEEIKPGLEDHNTLFKLKPGQRLGREKSASKRIKEAFSLFIPPVVFKIRDWIQK